MSTLIMNMKAWHLFLTLSVASSLLAGCGGATGVVEVDTKEVDAYLVDKPGKMHPLLTKVVVEGERNRVLNQMRAGLTAMESGHDDLAADLFDDALLTIEAVYGDNEKARNARNMFSAEDRKIFRGEPYERAMAYYYRGILYLMERDYENARASFKSGFLQDTLAEEEKYRGDFALLTFLEGWASQCNGNAGLAEEAYSLAREMNSRLVTPKPEDNTLILADLGYAPVKYADGDHQQQLKISANKRKAPKSVTWLANDTPHNLQNNENILWQATTRGGREFDAILENKVQFKESAEEASETLEAIAIGASAVSQVQSALGDHDSALSSAGIGMFAGLFSLAASSTSSATETAADTRYWDNLPEKVAYGTHQVDETTSEINVKFSSTPQRPLVVYPASSSKGCGLVWTRSSSPHTNL